MILSLSLTFEVEDEDAPDLRELCSDLEEGLAAVDGVEFASVDVKHSVRRFSLVAEIEGQVDPTKCGYVMEAVIAEKVKRLRDLQLGLPFELEGDDCA